MTRDSWPPLVTDDDRRRFPGWAAMMDEDAVRRIAEHLEAEGERLAAEAWRARVAAALAGRQRKRRRARNPARHRDANAG